MATTDNTVEIKIKVTEEQKKLYESLKSSRDAINQKGGFKGDKGIQAKNEVDNYLKSAEAYLKKGTLNKEQSKSLSENFVHAATTLAKFSGKIVVLSEAAQKLQGQIDKLTGKIEKNAAKRSDLGNQKVEALKNFNDLEGFKIFNKKKDGTASKVERNKAKFLEDWISEPDSVNDVVFQTPSGKQTDFNNLPKKYSDIFSNYQDIIKKLNALVESLKKDKDNLQKRTDQLNKEVTSNPQNDSEAFATAQQNLADSLTLQGKTDNAFEIQGVAEQTEKLTTTINKQQTALSKAFKAFTIYSTAVRLAKTALKEAVNTITSLDKSLTEQAMVTGKSRDEVYALLTSYQNLASQIGATTKEVAEAASEFMKQGKTIQDSLTLSEAAVSAAKVAGVSVAESINYLTTALNGFKLSASDAISVSDKFAAVAASSASDYDEIAIALSKVASQANLAGMSIDYTTALLTTGLEVTREAPETMGTALKTIIARMREISDYGETLEDGTDLNNVETQLKYIGIQLTSNSGELRSTEDVLDELGKKWDTLSSNQQAAVAKALAGTRQQSRLIAMMDNYDRVLELQEVSERSSGATAAQLEKYMEGIEASLNRVSVAWEKVVTTFSKSSLITGALDAVSNLLNYANSLFDNLGAQVALITAFGWALANVIAKRRLENEIAKEQLALQQEQQKAYLENQIKATEEKEKLRLQEEALKEAEVLANAKINAEQELIVAQKAEEQAQNEVNNAFEQEKLALIMQQEEEQNKLTLLKQQDHYQDLANEAETQQKKAEASGDTELANIYKQQVEDNLNKVKTTKNDITKQESNITTAKEIHEEQTNKLAEAQTKLAEAQKAVTVAEEKNLEITKKQTTLKNNLTNSEKNIRESLKSTNSVYKTQLEQLELLNGQNNLFSGSLLKIMSLQDLQKAKEAAYNVVAFAHLAWLKLTNKEKYNEIAAVQKAQAAKEGLAVTETKETATKGLETAASASHTLALKAEERAAAALEKHPIILMATAAVALITAVYALWKWVDSMPSKIERAAEAVGTLTNEIYELNQSQTAIESATSAWEEYDNKLIKTKKDAESLAETLKSVSDSLTKDQQKIYSTATTDKQRYALLKTFSGQNKASINEKWTEAMKEINKLSASDKAKVFSDLSSFSSNDELLSSATAIQSAVTAKNNQDLYDSIDVLTDLEDDEADALESLTQEILENMSASEQWAIQQNGGVKKFVNTLTQTESIRDAFVEFQNSENGLKDKIKYYKEISTQLEGNSAALKSFQDLYQQYEVYSAMDEQVLNLIEDLGITDDQINKLYNSYSTLKKAGVDISEEDYKSRFNTLLETFAETRDVALTIRSVFGDIVNDDNWNDFVQIFDTLEESLLNIGQNMENFDNKIDAFYTKASGWGDLTDSEKAEFLNDNAALFKGEDGKALYDAFMNQDYEQIGAALATNEELQKIYKSRLNEIETAIAVEKAKTGDSYNAAYVSYLEGLKEHLENVDDLFAASLETRLEQEENQLSEFKSLLEDQEDAIKDSLDKRKEAYQNYFDTVNEEADTEDYEETAQKYLANLSGIGASTDANSQAQRKELENKLEDLEQERLKTLRENAQEAIISNIENEIDAIGEKFDDLLDNSNQILQLMNGNLESDKTDFFSQLISNSASNGSTALGLQNYLQTLQSTYGNKLNGVDLSDIKVTQDTNNNLILNVNGETYNLNTSDEKSLYDTIYAALQKLGVK